MSFSGICVAGIDDAAGRNLIKQPLPDLRERLFRL